MGHKKVPPLQTGQTQSINQSYNPGERREEKCFIKPDFLVRKSGLLKRRNPWS